MTRVRPLAILDISHDLLFCLNAALLMRLVSVQTSLSSLEPNLKFRINSTLGVGPHSNVGGYIAFFLLAAGLAFVLYVLLWLLTAFVGSVFRLYYGFASVI